jgi:transposase-like protein
MAKKKSYLASFIKKALDLVHQGAAVSAVAKKMKCNSNNIYRWMKDEERARAYSRQEEGGEEKERIDQSI